ncbi:DUF3048 domain-containing protein [Cellulomonas denverensis]|uniref:DUF3048 domain-containing protein n=1 Tax=Cellulomonas denverensis TaxID=264297 RepID=A0A7X6KST0_9CELL|nr:DUF3048 domain-containing protein [Cellulomonas denverensis]NKY21621.1 DUF3048 domain-containing protein [Cellulomonas denverensis]GIG25512.1 hypothetical protein Cde04nite_17560 [Cellulomonas denverensis]
MSFLTARHRPRRTAGAVLGVCVAVLLAACGTGSPEPATSTAAPTLDPDKSAVAAPELPAVWPLTGEQGEIVNRPALAVKIENTAAARPQSGLNQADVVWETIVEFEVSRLVAVFHSQVPEEIGPIRSVRPMDTAITAPMNGLLAFSGGQAGILQMVADSPVQALSHDAGVDGMYRLRGRSAPHNVYATPETLWSQADGTHQDSPEQQFAVARSADTASAVQHGAPATRLDFSLSGQSSPAWVWNGEVWQRWEGSKEAMDAADDTQVHADNVISIVAEHPNTQFAAQGGAPVPTYTLVGSGTGTLASGGKTVDVTWQKDSESAPMRLFLADGTEATLVPGNTWVELVPAQTGSLTTS